MLTLKDDRDHNLQHVGHDGIIGRQAGAQLRLRHGRVSAQHASIRWNGIGWELKDLGSHNGTAVDGRQLDAHTWVPLQLGSTVHLGSEDCAWTVVGVDKPVMYAERLDTGARLLAQEQQIDFKDFGVDAELTFCPERATFVLRIGDITADVRNGGLVDIGSIPLRLWLPPQSTPAVPASRPPSPAR